MDYRIRVQLLEIYNEQLRDLLVEGPPDAPRRLDIRSTAASGVNVPDALQARCVALHLRTTWPVQYL